MKKYDHKKIEKKWQKYWNENLELSEAKENSDKPKFYCLDMFPYPSGAGLHVGHVENYTATDIYSRFKRMNGFNVIHPIGWDAFGLPAENYAIKNKIHPDKSTHDNIKNFTKQIKSIGISYDWSREIDTSSPEYYKWTQWFFLFLYKNGLAYKKKAKSNWCESCKTVVANEQVVDGKCERCGGQIIQKDLEQWFFKITDFIEDFKGENGQKFKGLINGLDNIDWPSSTKVAQKNWIGKSEGAIINFKLNNSEKEIKVFTTRVDTIFGCTYVVLAPESKLVDELKEQSENKEEIEKYIAETKKKTDLERMENKEKTGIEMNGIKAINPFNNEEVPIYVADYVIATYGTGAVMAVPAHDERDFEFAKKYNLEIRQSIAPLLIGEGKNKTIEEKELIKRKSVDVIIKHWKEDEYYCLDWKYNNWKSFVIGGVKDGETLEEAALREAREETGYKNIRIIKKIGGEIHSQFFAIHKDINRYSMRNCFYAELIDGEFKEPEEEHIKNHSGKWIKKEDVAEFLTLTEPKNYWDIFLNGEKATTEDGVLINTQNNIENKYLKTKQVLDVLSFIKNESNKEDLKFWVLGGLSIAFYSGQIYREHSDLDLITNNDDNYEKLVNLLKKIGFEKIEEKKLSDKLSNTIFKNSDGIEVDMGRYLGEFGMIDDDFEKEERELLGIKSLIISKRFIQSFKEFQIKNRNEEKDKLDFEYLKKESFFGLTSQDAREKMTAWLEKEGKGEKKVNYRLRDWLVSRQRYWGAPIPIIYCDKCGEVAVSEKDLPVKLPTDVDFKPTGESPLAISKSFHDVNCPLCGEKARRESDTMDTFVCSSWYYLRFADPKNEKEFASKESLEKWLPVDLYMGGAEHTVLHLLYSRFFTKALAKYGYINFDEPFLKLRHQGMIMAEDGRKMSKSLGNVVNPDDVVEAFGADALRLYEMFMGPIDEVKAWSMQNVNGPKNFLEKIWKIFQEKELVDCKGECKDIAKELPVMLHKTIKKVTQDVEGFNFNTAISQMMIFINEFSKHDKLPRASMEKFLILLAPFAPYIAEEIWQEILGHKKSIFLESWPEFDETMTKDEEVEMVVQVNGKIRDRITVSAEISEDEAKKIALESEKVKGYIEGKEIRKIIYIKGKLVSIVI